MAFPSVTGTNTNSNASTTNHTCDLPVSVGANDLILAFMVRGSTAATWPAGWTSLRIYDGTVDQETRWRRGPDPAGASIVVTTPGNTGSTFRTFKISGAHATAPPEISAGISGNSTSPNPDSVTASWGSDDNLFCAACYRVLSTNPVNTYPANYTLDQTSTVTGSSAMGQAFRQLASATDDPGAFGFTGSVAWAANTIVFRPAAPAGFPFSPNPFLPLFVR